MGTLRGRQWCEVTPARHGPGSRSRWSSVYRACHWTQG
jgi:hypothetical protein